MPATMQPDPQPDTKGEEENHLPFKSKADRKGGFGRRNFRMPTPLTGKEVHPRVSDVMVAADVIALDVLISISLPHIHTPSLSSLGKAHV